MKHPGTDDATFQEVIRFVEAAKLVPIKLEREQLGYIINSLLVPRMTAAISLVVNGVATAEDVDKTWMICARGMPMGPLGVADQVGFDVAANVIRLLAAADPDNPQHAKNLAYIEARFLSKGHTGLLSGRGFYRYPDPAYLEPGFLRAV